MKRSATIGIRVTPEMKAQLELLAAAERRRLTDYLVIMIEDHLRTVAQKKRSK